MFISYTQLQAQVIIIYKSFMDDQDNYNKIQDLNLQVNRHPAILELQDAVINHRPNNTYHFIKSWAQKKLKERGQSSDQDQLFQREKISMKKKTMNELLKRRNAVFMAEIQSTSQSKRFMLKQSLIKNEECRSRIMIGLRNVSLLQSLSWEDIDHLVQISQVRQYYKGETFVQKGQQIDSLYILIHGDLKRIQNGINTSITQGSTFFIETLISLVKCKFDYMINSDSALICGINSFSIHERLKTANIKRAEFYEKILMAIPLFSPLDEEEMYHLLLMIKQSKVYKPDQIVIEKNQPVNRVYLIFKGEFNICRKSLSGQITAFQVYKEGQFFGEEWIIKGQSQCQFLVMAKTEGILGHINRQEIQNGITKISNLVQRKKTKLNKR